MPAGWAAGTAGALTGDDVEGMSDEEGVAGFAIFTDEDA